MQPTFAFFWGGGGQASAVVEQKRRLATALSEQQKLHSVAGLDAAMAAAASAPFHSSALADGLGEARAARMLLAAAEAEQWMQVEAHVVELTDAGALERW